jgi:hypothetical protein
MDQSSILSPALLKTPQFKNFQCSQPLQFIRLYKKSIIEILLGYTRLWS